MTHISDELKEGNIGRVGAHLTYTAFDQDLVTYYCSRKTDNDEVLISVLGNDLVLDVSAPGITQELLTHRIKEPVATRAYRKELHKIDETHDDPIILEVGANVGYYLLQAADILGEDTRIYAFEPGENNIEQLQKNVCLNGYSERVELIQAAVGDTVGTAQFRIEAAGNKNHVVEGETGTNITEVDLTTLDQFVRDHEIDYGEIDAIRMDAQGYEYNIIQGMSEILEESDTLLLFVEVHPNMLGEQLEPMINMLDRYDFEIVSASGGWWFTDEPYDMSSLSELTQHKRSVELILRK